ncbi:MAG: penicillin acylase family protein [Pseudomonadota bacterium]
MQRYSCRPARATRLPYPLALVCALCASLLLGACTNLSLDAASQEFERLQQIALRVEIIRDDYGVPHIYAPTDADAVFGLLYAQAEDDFARIERNYIWAIGRLAEIEGEQALASDLRARLYMTEAQARIALAAAPDWLQKLCRAFADGLNFYLATHPDVQPALLERFEPWMPMYFFEGSIGGDIEQIPLDGISTFYDLPGRRQAIAQTPHTPTTAEPVGSNGFAIAPERSASGNALLLINPHTSFFFRGEVHVVSEEGLNAYGAVTWGQFFVYQGFNERTGWMHTSTRADFMDEYLETVRETDAGYEYLYGDEWRPVQARPIVLKARIAEGEYSLTPVMGYRTHHGPVTGARGERWLSTRINWEPEQALAQSYLRMKTSDYDGFRATMERRTNSSNNTVFADASGNIAYFHGNFMPRRNTGFDFSRPVDGSDPDTDWQGRHEVDEMIVVRNPRSGWLQNCNSTPFTAAGKHSPRRADFPPYMAPDPENFRGLHAAELLEDAHGLTLKTLQELAYSTRLRGMDPIVEGLQTAWQTAGNEQPRLRDAIALLSAWDRRVAVDSEAMTLAHFYGVNLLDALPARSGASAMAWIKRAATESDADTRLRVLAATMQELQVKFGDWRVPWGNVNRYQRLTGAIDPEFSDAAPSTAIPMASALWGALASYGVRKRTDVDRLYGRYGNSFVAVVEFGPRLRAMSLLAGGQSGAPDSPHFGDQVALYAEGRFKSVAFYREDVNARARRQYRPGRLLPTPEPDKPVSNP